MSGSPPLPTIVSKSSAIAVRPYSPNDAEHWDSFVWQSNNGTFFHLQRFLSYHPEGRFTFHHLLFYRGTTLLAVLPAALMDNGQTLESQLGQAMAVLFCPCSNTLKMNSS